ncbi:MAG TPA: hypothetical protein DER05_00960 [Lutibacter sp.]|nr:hypothetical protein [Lutibacter sp.]
MSKPRYLYIDDENGSSEISTLNGFNDTKIVEVARFNLSAFRDFGSLKKELERACKNNEFDGLIIDLRLDGAGEDRTEFNATAITSELRSISARGDIRSFPIVLCSTEEKIKQTYDSDRSSHDLFDYKLSKSNTEPDWIKISTKLKSLADGYNWIQATKREPAEIIGISNLEVIDERITQKLLGFSVTYDFTHFVIKNFFHQTNPLISERVLAARLGVDLAKTPCEVWEKLSLSILDTVRYKGLFSEGWKRWWTNDLVDWFKSISGENLAFMDAKGRINILSKNLGLEGIAVAEPIKFCTSSEFWTICEGYKVPIDPLEGFKVHTTADLKPWQESKVISLLAILEREGFVDRGIKPHLSELERIEFTKEQLGIK